MSTDVGTLRRRDIEAYIAARLATVKPATVAIAYRSLRVFFNWCVSEDEIAVSPMAKVRCPIVPVQPPTVLTDEQIAALLHVCEGKDFVSRRDMAMIRVLLDSGIRRSECAGLKVSDIDLVAGTATVLGKGRRIRVVPIGKRSSHALDRYLRMRANHNYSYLPDLWLGKYGAMTDSGLYQALRSRGESIGMPNLYLHLLRHTFAHLWLANQGSENSLMQIAGWRNRSLIERYGASGANSRARNDHKLHSPGDRF